MLVIGKEAEEISIEFSFLGKVGQLPSIVSPAKETATAAAVDPDSEEDDMERRLQALRS